MTSPKKVFRASARAAVAQKWFDKAGEGKCWTEEPRVAWVTAQHLTEVSEDIRLLTMSSQRQELKPVHPAVGEGQRKRQRVRKQGHDPTRAGPIVVSEMRY